MALNSGEMKSGGEVRDQDGYLIIKSAGSSSGTGETTVDEARTSTATEGSGSANVTTTTSTLIAANTSRMQVDVVNDSDSVIYLALGEAAVLNKGIRLNANGGSWTSTKWTGDIRGITASGTKVVTYVEIG